MRSIGRKLTLAIAAILTAGGAAAREGSAAGPPSDPSATERQAELARRLDALKPSRLEVERGGDAPERIDAARRRIAQWYNWSDWNNGFSDWRNF